jgi:DNA polymerase-3 subunit delta'
LSFENIIGNDKVKELLNKTIISNNILHSYLFVGIEGIGKQEIAKEFAKMILCTENNKPCNNCKSCLQFQNNNNPDFMQINIEEKSIKIEQIRYMQEKISEKPITSNRKVYIINDSETMTREAQNCLLKTLEEPPEYATIILISSNENKLLNTIRSRCIKVNFNKLSNEEIQQYLEKNENKQITSSMLQMCSGSIGNALKIAENKDVYIKVEELINNINKKDLIDILNNADVLYNSKDIIQDLLNYINVLLYNMKQIEGIK